jgi:broad specificity phosphatase PhoE
VNHSSRVDRSGGGDDPHLVNRLWLVRHGRATAGWGEDADPPLSPEGRGDAEVAADLLAPGGSLPVVTSPLRRTRQTAEVIAGRWASVHTAADEVTEVPSSDPLGSGGELADPVDAAEALAARAAWLAGFLVSEWRSQPAWLWAWRRRLLGFLGGCTQPTVVVTHAVAINTVLSAARLSDSGADDRVFTVAVAPGSVTVVDVRGAGRREPAPSFEVVAVGATDPASLIW